MAVAQFRTLKEFFPDSESVKDYLERVQLYIEANEVPRQVSPDFTKFHWFQRIYPP